MRTTVTLDDDVAKRLEHARRERNSSFKDVLNEALRAGLPVLDRTDRPAGKIQRTRAMELGKQLVNVDNVAEALAIAEKDDFR